MCITRISSSLQVFPTDNALSPNFTSYRTQCFKPSIIYSLHSNVWLFFSHYTRVSINISILFHNEHFSVSTRPKKSSCSVEKSKIYQKISSRLKNIDSFPQASFFGFNSPSLRYISLWKLNFVEKKNQFSSEKPKNVFKIISNRLKNIDFPVRKPQKIDENSHWCLSLAMQWQSYATKVYTKQRVHGQQDSFAYAYINDGKNDNS